MSLKRERVVVPPTQKRIAVLPRAREARQRPAAPTPLTPV